MILRSILILLPFVALAVCVSFKDLAPQLKGFYPKKLANFYNSLTVDQEKLIDDAIMSNSSSREAQYMAIKKKNPELESKFKGVNEDFVKNLSSLSYYANNYYYFRILQRIEILQRGATEDQLNEFAADIIQDWQTLSNETQKELREKFPDIVETINSTPLEKFASKAPYIKPYLIYLIQKWDLVPAGVRKHLTESLPELAEALNSTRVRAYVNQNFSAQQEGSEKRAVEN